MFCIGDTVLYGSQGVCKIIEIAEKTFGGDTILYYVLKPVYDENSTVFVPVSNAALVAKMRSVLSAEEVYDMIREMPDEETIWIDDENERKQQYHHILAESDRRKLVKMIKTLHLHRTAQNQKGRKLHQSDENMLKQAEKLLYNEFAMVLNIKPDEVLPFILEQIDVEKKGA